MENGLLLVTAVGRNGTACSHCCHQLLEKGPTVYETKIGVSHALSLWQHNPRALCINALCICLCAYENSPVLEQARRMRDVPKHVLPESPWLPVQLRSRPPSDAAGICQKTKPTQATNASRPTTLWEKSKESWLFSMPYQTLQGLLLLQQLASAGKEALSHIKCS